MESEQLPVKAQELLQSIRSDMRLTKAFFKYVYGWELDYSGFADQAISALKAAGCSRACEYYEEWVQEYKAERDAVLKKVSVWYAEELKRRRAEKERKVREERKEKARIQSLTRNELTELCQRLLQEGVISNPEQFAMVAGQDL